MSHSEHANAHEFWNTQWQDLNAHSQWSQAEPWVLDILKQIAPTKEQAALKALDLGCGIGRHGLAMATMGFDTSCCDASTASVGQVNKAMADIDLPPCAIVGKMTELPYEDQQFDFVLAWNVIYHGLYVDLKKAVAEISRVLKPKGLFQGTLISKTNRNFQVGRQLDSHTWINPLEADKAHAHCYVDKMDVEILFPNFEILEFCEVDHHNYAGAWHWHILAKKES